MNIRYINEFINSNCAPDLLANKLFPNAKEVTESFGALHALGHIGLDFADPNIMCVVPGDGCTPRTGALVAFKTKWTVISVDPRLREPWNGTVHSVKRLHCFPEKVEDWGGVFQEGKTIVVMSVHSHAQLSEVLKKITAKHVHVIDIPCCEIQKLNRMPHLSYDDIHIISPKRQVNIWKDIDINSARSY